MKKLWYLPIIMLSIGLLVCYVIMSGKIEYSKEINIIIFYAIALLYILSFISIFPLVRKQNNSYLLIKIALVCKVILIPCYIYNFIFGLISGVAILGFPPLFVVATALAVFLSLAMLFITSLYSTIGIVQFYKDHGLRYGRILVITQWIYCIDVIALLGIFIYIKKIKKQKEEENADKIQRRFEKRT